MTHPKKMLGVIQAHMIVKLVARSTLQSSAALTAKKTCAKLQLSFILATRQVAIIKLSPLRNWKQTLSLLLFPSYAKNTTISSAFDEKCGHAVCRECVALEQFGHLCLPLAEAASEYGKEVKDLIKKTSMKTGSAVERNELETERARLEKEVGELQGLLEKVKLK